MREEAAAMLRSRIDPAVLGDGRGVIPELCGGWGNRKSGGKDGRITMAQAIVLAQGLRALDGEKNAAEFLLKISEEAGVRQEEAQEEAVTVRINMTE